MPHLDEDVEAQAVDVVHIAQAKQAGKQTATEHAHCQVESDGQALPDDAAAMKTKQKKQQYFFNTSTLKTRLYTDHIFYIGSADIWLFF